MVHPRWTVDDLRIVGDVVMASLIGGALRLILLKAFIEPAATWLGQKGYQRLDKATGDRLPDLFAKGERP